MSVCLQHNSKTNELKVFKLDTEISLRYPISITVFGLKGQRSRSQGHKVQKYIESDRVAGVSLHCISSDQRLVAIIILVRL